MNDDKFNINEDTLSVDLNEATLAVKENRFDQASKLLDIISVSYTHLRAHET